MKTFSQLLLLGLLLQACFADHRVDVALPKEYEACCGLQPVDFKHSNGSIYMPNVFTPNGDGINDVWTIRYLDSYVGAIIRVFDRYGKNVFTSTGYQVPWNGKYKDKDVPVGVYYYIIDPKNGRKPISGSVTIVR